jgi:hypothetical protein
MSDILSAGAGVGFRGTFSLVDIGGLAATLLPLMTGMPGGTHDYTPRSSYVIQRHEASSSVSRIEFGLSVAVQEYQPRTPLAKKLLAIRERAIAKGMILLNEEEVLKEVESRRGEANYG